MSAFTAELLAICMAMGEAQSQNLPRVHFESDSLSSVFGIGDSALLFDADVEGIFEAIREIALLYPSWSYLKVSRQANAFADSLAKWTASWRVFGCIDLNCLPVSLLRQSFCFEPP
ncbi:hypothetical protein CJ030_MR3G018985 [Morella rubra]|nr:hypothetical protein CJ030_MR3G018985 [Morella rubra]